METFYQFMSSYADFLEDAAQDEEQKQKALATCDLGRMDQTIAAQQATLMQLEGFEKQREQMAEDAGFAGCTFREILDRLNGGEQKRFEELFSRFEKAIADIKYYNDKCMEIARTDLQVIRGVIPDDTQPNYVPGKGTLVKNSVSSVFEAKI